MSTEQLNIGSDHRLKLQDSTLLKELAQDLSTGAMEVMFLSGKNAPGQGDEAEP